MMEQERTEAAGAAQTAVEDTAAPVDGGAHEPAVEAADATSLTQQLEDARREAAQNYDRYLRAHADMDNYKKRIERTYADLSRNSKKDLLLKLLSVKDNLERALGYRGEAEGGQSESVIQGVRLTEYQLDQLLRGEGVTPIDVAGQPFDPQHAEAVSTVVDPSVPDHSVVHEVQRGYMYGDSVLRPAKVVVAVHTPNEQP